LGRLAAIELVALQHNMRRSAATGANGLGTKLFRIDG
jgi:hypothetical protein